MYHMLIIDMIISDYPVKFKLSLIEHKVNKLLRHPKFIYSSDFSAPFGPKYSEGDELSDQSVLNFSSTKLTTPDPSGCCTPAKSVDDRCNIITVFKQLRQKIFNRQLSLFIESKEVIS